MMTMITNWKGSLEVNGIKYTNINAFLASNTALSGSTHIKLYPVAENAVKGENKPQTSIQEAGIQDQEYVITVKKYMTEKAEPTFDFMAKWNNNNPMPLRTMVGIKTKETRGMVYMKLHGDIVSKVMQTCMCCGKPITNPVSRYFGMGPICGSHNYVNPFDTEEELKAAVGNYRVKLQNITWEGWIIKSAITEEKPFVREEVDA